MFLFCLDTKMKLMGQKDWKWRKGEWKVEIQIKKKMAQNEEK